MLTDAERQRLTARWLGEALRETAILVWVFVPLDWFLGEHQYKALALVIAFALSAGFFRLGMHFGFEGESLEC